MATEAQFLASRGGAIGVAPANVRLNSTMLIQLVISGTGTVSTGSLPIPPSWITSVATSTPTAISGTPTSCNVRVGITSTGQEIMADTDLKAQQNSAGTIPASFDRYGNTASAIFAQVVTTGGTAPAGVINLAITLHPL